MVLAILITAIVALAVTGSVRRYQMRKAKRVLNAKITALREAREDRARYSAISSRVEAVRQQHKVHVPPTKSDARPSYVEPEHVSLYVGAEAFAPIPMPDPTPSYDPPSYDYSASFDGGNSSGGGAGSDW